MTLAFREIARSSQARSNRTKYSYDAASRLIARVYPDGSVLNVSHDGAGRPIGITDPWGDITRYVYDAAGRRIETKSSASGLSTSLAYDARGRLASIASTRSDGTPATSYTYPIYDEAGNRKQQVDTLSTLPAKDYTYDALHRLVDMNPFGGGSTLTLSYQYDAGGNRTRSGLKNGSAFVAPYRDYAYASPGPAHRLTSVTTDAGAPLYAFPGYDANGNPTTWSIAGGSPRVLSWDALDRLSAIGGSFSASYVYDPFGRRIEKTEQGVTTLYQYDGLDVVVEYDAERVQQATYVFGPGIDEPLRIARGATVGAFHTDGLGSVLLVTRTGGAAENLARYRYDPFGVDEEPAVDTVGNVYSYTGRERDASGLYYYRARYYLPELGRFLTPDPMGLAAGENPYAYVGSNPVNFKDPFGLFGTSTLTNMASPIGFPGLSSNIASRSFNTQLGLPANLGSFDNSYHPSDYSFGPSHGLLEPESRSRPSSMFDYSATWVAGAATLGALPAAASALEGSTLYNQALMAAAPIETVVSRVTTKAYIDASLAVGAALTAGGSILNTGKLEIQRGGLDFYAGFMEGAEAGYQGNVLPGFSVPSVPGYVGTVVGVGYGVVERFDATEEVAGVLLRYLDRKK